MDEIIPASVPRPRIRRLEVQRACRYGNFIKAWRQGLDTDSSNKVPAGPRGTKYGAGSETRVKRFSVA